MGEAGSSSSPIIFQGPLLFNFKKSSLISMHQLMEMARMFDVFDATYGTVFPYYELIHDVDHFVHHPCS